MVNDLNFVISLLKKRECNSNHWSEAGNRTEHWSTSVRRCRRTKYQLVMVNLGVRSYRSKKSVLMNKMPIKRSKLSTFLHLGGGPECPRCLVVRFSDLGLRVQCSTRYRCHWSRPLSATSYSSTGMWKLCMWKLYARRAVAFWIQNLIDVSWDPKLG